MKNRPSCPSFLIIIALISEIPKSYGFDETIYSDQSAAIDRYQDYADAFVYGLVTPEDRRKFAPFAFLEYSNLRSVGRVDSQFVDRFSGEILSYHGSAFVAGSRYTALTANHNVYNRERSRVVDYIFYHGVDRSAYNCNWIINKTYATTINDERGFHDYAVLYDAGSNSFDGNLVKPISVAFDDDSHVRAIHEDDKKMKYLVGYPGEALFQYYSSQSWRGVFSDVEDKNSQKLIDLNRKGLFRGTTEAISPYFNGHTRANTSALDFNYKNLGTGRGASGGPVLVGANRLYGDDGWSEELRQTTHAPGLVTRVVRFWDAGDQLTTAPVRITNPTLTYFAADYRVQTLMINTALQIMQRQPKATDFPTTRRLPTSLEALNLYNEARTRNVTEIPINAVIQPNTPTRLARITLDFATADVTDSKNTMPGIVLPWLVWQVNSEEDVGQADVTMSLEFKSYNTTYTSSFDSGDASGSLGFDLTNFLGSNGKYRVLDTHELNRTFEIWITSKRQIFIEDPLLLKHIERTY